MYQSLYRKYRPQTFMEIYGQDAISQTLTNAIIYDRVAHAYSFSGPRGTGKTSTAKLLAKALNCTNIKDGKICDECDDCLLVKNNNHPDVIEIDAASNNGVDEVRDLIEKVKYAPIKGRKKVYIIDEVHMMSQGAFNALLKTLEEPPEHVVFILATTEQHKVLPTIKSRCQKFDFKKLNEADIMTCMKDILTKEECQYEEDALHIIATLCDGGMRDALSLLEQVMIYSNNNITVTAVNEALDLVSQEEINKLYELVKKRNLDEALAYVNKLDQGSVDYKQVINEVIKKTMDDLIKQKVEKNDLNVQKYLLNMIEKFDESLDKLKYDNSKKLYLDLAIIKTVNYKGATFTETIEVEKEAVEQISSITEQSYNNDKDIVEDEPVSEEEENLLSEDIKIEKSDDEMIEQQVNEDIDRIKQDIVDEAELMNVLVQASRNDLDFVKEKWSLLNDYLLNINTKKNAGLLIESIPVAASNNAMIVVCSDSYEVSLINNSTNVEGIASFINEMMSEQRYCFAITQDNWKMLKDKYLQLRQVNRLPKAKQVLENAILSGGSKKEVNDSESENELLSFGKQLFKDKLVVKRKDDYNEY